MKKIIGIVEMLIGAYFLCNIASDIQLGFGLVILMLGANLLVSSRK